MNRHRLCRKRRFREILDNERGSVLLMVFFCGLMITVLGLTAFYVANTEITQSSKRYEMAKALYLAEGGIERAIVELKAGLGDGWDDEVAGVDGDLGTDDDGILSFGDQVNCFVYGDGEDVGDYGDGQQGGTGYWHHFLGHYDVRIVDGRRPGESPDKCNRVIIGSDGISTKNFKQRVESEVVLWRLNLPEALVFIYGRGMDTKFDGNSFLLDGKDTNPNGSFGLGPDVPAILVSGWEDASAIRNEVGANQCDQVLGVGNLFGDNPCAPSVTELGSWNPTGFNPLLFRSDDLPKVEEMVNNEIAGGTYAGHTTIGADDNYLVTKCTGDLHITGQFDGFGILIVEGDLVVTGKGEWHGLIIVKNHARMSGGGNGFHLFGTILIMDQSGLDGDDEWRISGQADGFFCRETITRIQDSVETLVVNTWRQSVGL